jgi:hypothetical protein
LIVTTVLTAVYHQIYDQLLLAAIAVALVAHHNCPLAGRPSVRWTFLAALAFYAGSHLATHAAIAAFGLGNIATLVVSSWNALATLILFVGYLHADPHAAHRSRAPTRGIVQRPSASAVRRAHSARRTPPALRKAPRSSLYRDVPSILEVLTDCRCQANIGVTSPAQWLSRKNKTIRRRWNETTLLIARRDSATVL